MTVAYPPGLATHWAPSESPTMITVIEALDWKEENRKSRQ